MPHFGAPRSLGCLRMIARAQTRPSSIQRKAAMDEFEHMFGRPAATQVETHGRVNLIGEHTDYNGGFVLPTLIPQRTHVRLAPRDDNTARAASLSMSPEP